MVKGMARTKPAERARKRTLDDQEITDLYEVLDALHGTVAVQKCFGPFVRFLLLSAQRLRMVSNMRWEEIDGLDWIVPRHKGKGRGDHVVPLTDGLLALVGPKQKAGFVFTSDGKTSFKGFSKAKAALDTRLAETRRGSEAKADGALDLSRPAADSSLAYEPRRCAKRPCRACIRAYDPRCAWCL
jgi:integrase